MQTPDYLLVDYETRSFADLKKVGGRVYAADPTTEVLSVAFGAYDADAERWEVWSQWAPGEWPFNEPPGDVVAHNAVGFDRFIWSRMGWPEPRRWVDSAILARRAGFALSSLEFMGAHYGIPKDKEGNKLTVGLSRRKRKGGVPQGFAVDPIPAETRARVLAYNEADIHTTARIVEDLALEFDFGIYPEGTWQHVEEQVFRVDLELADRGIAFDDAFARALDRQEVLAATAACELAGVTPEQVRSVPQFRALMAAAGHPVPNGKRGTVEKIDHPLVAARLACTSITRGKLAAGLRRALNGRLHDNTKYLGAHTWRWSGQAMQLQNLPRGAGCAACDRAWHECQCGDIYERILAA